MTELIEFLKMILVLLPFVLLALLNYKANLKKPERHKQFLMPVIALLLCTVAMILLSKIYDLMVVILENLDTWLFAFSDWLREKLPDALQFLSTFVQTVANWVKKGFRALNLNFWAFYLGNALLMLVYVILKKIILAFLKGLFKDGGLFQTIAGNFYEYDEDSGKWGLISKFGQARTFLKWLYIAAVVVGVAGVLVSSHLYLEELLTALYYPVFSVIILGELYFFLDGLTLKEQRKLLTGEEEEAQHVSNYSVMCGVLRKLFPDKLNAENTSLCDSLMDGATNDELLSSLEESDRVILEAYGRFMRAKSLDGMELDFNYLLSGKQLLEGQSVLFNNPFYYDLIPYLFYPMNRALLRHRKILLVLGRHGAQDSIGKWCEDGLSAVTHIPGMWNIGVLGQEAQELDVGIVTRSSVNDLKLHEANRDFFDDVEMVVLLEPSRLVTTAQVGLNSLVRHCRRNTKKPLVFCSADKNCDGLLDALSHILMTSLKEVSATNHHKGCSSYMIWEADGEHLQHRMLPNLSRYLGMGTELSFAALKNQIPQTAWYGGEAFPVDDIRWITRQYYYDLLRYANLPANQETLERVFKTSADMWSAPVMENQYITVEDESFNMFEVKRDFATRATNQGFVNVLCTDYMLKDYMAANDSIFNADPKAIPYITADYARTVRNVVLRLCLRMSTAPISVQEIHRELVMVDCSGEDPIATLWEQICQTCSHMGKADRDQDGHLVLNCRNGDEQAVFTCEVLESKRRFNVDTGAMETMYTITNGRFIRMLLRALQPAEYVAEDENGTRQYLGTELRGHIFQKFLPGQFFTFGGKYYEMLRVTSEGQVLVRRAADHITGRPSYRQERSYFISTPVDSTVMGECRDMGAFRITRQFADIRVQTPAYWQMKRHNDFSTARRIGINGVPERVYSHKALLRLELDPEGKLPAGTVQTLTLLINEVLRTLLAENQDYLAAVCAGDAQVPNTYSLYGDDGFQPDAGSIYLIEDSQMDIGLLDAVERHLNRIFAIIWDYLTWHKETLDAELNQPEPEPSEEPVPAEAEDGQEKATPKKVGFFGRIGRAIGGFFKKIFGPVGRFFKKIFGGIGAFFKKLFGKKKKQKTPEGVPEIDWDDPVEETPTDDLAPPTEDDLAPPAWDPEEDLGEPAEAEFPEAEPTDAPVEEASQAPLETIGEQPAEPERTEPAPAEAPAPQTQSEPVGAEEQPEEDAPVLTPEEEPSNDEPEEMMMLSLEGNPSELEEPYEDDGLPEVEDAPVDTAEGADNDTVDFEPEKILQPGLSFQRPKYQDRYYLRYGSQELAQTLALDSVLELLTNLGYGNNFLTQARKGTNVAQMVERDFVPNRTGTSYCDFCGCELTGMEYDVLADGRERCVSCSRTAVKTVEEFVALHDAVLKNMKMFFGVKINAPVHVQMVNSKKLHRKLGKTFIPTGKSDGRILGVAIKDKKGYSILVENGAPKLQSTMTMVHEMTHIWQYLNWNGRAIKKTYGADELEVYEGMAKWVEIQYAYMLNEVATAKREELITQSRDDPYGKGFVKYRGKYPLTEGPRTGGPTPFDNTETPL